jgi:uncharacterized membrane protein
MIYRRTKTSVQWATACKTSPSRETRAKGRLEAFSDGVIAIIITIMVLELKVPHGADLAALQPLLPVPLSYVLSFVYIGIYWNKHQHDNCPLSACAIS